MTESKKKKSCEKICEKKNFVFAISKKVENDHNYANYQQHFSLNYD